MKVKFLWIAQSPFNKWDKEIEWSKPDRGAFFYCEEKEIFVEFKKYVIFEIEEDE